MDPTDSEDFDAKAFVVSQRQAAQDREAEARVSTDFSAGSKAAVGASPGIGRWIGRLPTNVSVGLLDAGIASAEFVEDTVELAAPEGGGTPGSATPRRGPPSVLGNEPLSVVDTGAFEAVKGFRDYFAEGSNAADQVTQGLAQFTIPFMGWARAFGGISRAHSTARNLLTAAGAETATSAVNLLPDTGRFADVVELGRHAEGKFGDALRTVAPDGSLINQYINYMTDEDTGPWEGRFKNTVDSLVTSAAVGGLLKTGATTFKTARLLPEYVTQSAGATRPGRAGQEGMVAFHGTGQENIEKFDITKVGTGQGAQTFGHGLYFAENPKTAGHYRRMLSSAESSPAMDEAMRVLRLEGGDRQRAFAKLTRNAAAETDPMLRDLMQRGAQLIKSGAAKERGALYTVDIPDEAVAKMLDWDAPLGEQAPAVRKALEHSDMLSNINAGRARLGFEPLTELPSTWTGEDIYRSISETPVFSSGRLNELGIPGIKYFDQGSRAAGAGTRNIVLFDDKLVKILKKE